MLINAVVLPKPYFERETKGRTRVKEGKEVKYYKIPNGVFERDLDSMSEKSIHGKEELAI